MYKITLMLCFFLLLLPPLRAQEKLRLRVVAPEADAGVVAKYRYGLEFPDSVSAVKEVQSLVLALQDDGYLTASADTLVQRADTLLAVLYVGAQYQWARLKPGNLSEGLIEKSGFRERFYRDKPFRPKDYVKLQENLLELAENSGYPFASVYLDSIQIDSGRIDAVLRLDTGPLITFDSIQIQGNSKISPKFLTRYLQLQPGLPYQQERVETSARLLKQLPYLRETRPLQVRFSGDKARVYYFLEDKKANQIDGIVGVLPDPTAPASERKLLITGEANLNIRNIKGSGKQLGVQWRKTDVASQILNGDYIHPSFLGTPIEVAANFNLFKQDTSFITIKPRLQFSYYTLRYGKVGFFAEFRNSRLLKVSTLQSLRSIDAQYNSYGVNYLWTNLDDYYFPRRGLLANLQGAIGNKTIVRNASVEKLAPAFYDTLQLRTTQLTFSGRLEHYLKLGRNSVVLSRLRGETLLNDQLFFNDLFRLGGLSTLRGFDDFFFYASSYGVGTLEYRLFTAEDSYFLLFVDQAYYRRDIKGNFAEDTPTGFGGGVSFGTGAGIFQFIYSLGRAKGQPVNFGAGKIHFGFITNFR